MSAKRVKSPEPAAAGTPTAGGKERGRVRWIAVGLVAASLLAYLNSFRGAWIFDDFAAVVNNPTLRSWGTAFFPPGGGITVTGRPVLNFSFALSYALSGQAVWGHHLLNWLIHTAAGLALFGIVRRSLQLPALAPRWREAALPLGGLGALLWLVHPLQTESVTYIVQRAESLMGLCFFLTFYAYVRSLTTPRPHVWWIASVGACLLGVGTKEVIVTAPLLVLLHDRAFAAGSLAGAWRARRGLYLGLFGTWIPLAALVLGAGGNRGGSVGFGAEADPLAYWLTQFEAVVCYLKLCVWPHPLVFEYGTFWKSGFGVFVPCVVLVTALVLGTAWALVRRPALGFLGAWFFVLLSPTSVMPGTTQMIVEHRIYLPLAGVLVLALVGLWTWLGRRAVLVVGGVAVVFTGLTLNRNADYRDEVGLWEDTLRKRPDNATAHDSFAVALSRAGRQGDVLAHLETAARLAPNRSDYLGNYGAALSRAGRPAEAVVQFNRALQLSPNYALAHVNLGLALQQLGRAEEARQELERGVQLDPSNGEAQSSLGSLLVNRGRVAEALPHLEQAIRLLPNYAPARVNYGVALMMSERLSEAEAQLQVAQRLDASVPEMYVALGVVLIKQGRYPEGKLRLEESLRLRPGFRPALDNLERLRVLLDGK